MTKRTLGLVLSSVVVLATGVASAGYNGSAGVTFPTAKSATGTIPGARNSADTVQLIFCNTYAYSSGGESGSCYAKNAAGVSKQCFAGNPQQLAVMRSASAASWIYFSIDTDGSTCAQVSIDPAGSDSFK